MSSDSLNLDDEVCLQSSIMQNEHHGMLVCGGEDWGEASED